LASSSVPALPLRIFDLAAGAALPGALEVGGLRVAPHGRHRQRRELDAQSVQLLS
jgi:hypothetical protein